MSTPSRDTVPPGTVPSPGAPPGGAPRRGPALVAAGVVFAVAAGYAGHQLWPAAPHATRPAAVQTLTARVVRTDLAARQVIAGTLGYQGAFSVVSELGGGVLTALPAPGDVIRRGQPLFALSGQPVTLLYGGVPAWRTFAAGMVPGPDVRELQRNLAALGFDPGRADGEFGWATQLAVDRWQQARGMTVTGTIPLGTVAFLPGPLRVTTTPSALGALVAPGTSVVSGTSLTPGVQVSLTVGGPVVRAGDQVLVTLPDGTTTVPGTVTAVGRVASTPVSDAGANSGAGATPGAGAIPGGASGNGGQAAVIGVTITIRAAIPAGLDQAPVQVAITQQRADGVLAVPVTALLATAGGGYALQATGPHERLIPVTTGLFDDATDLVAVTGAGLTAGLPVAVAQG
jgi:peptidoglycan hydrolase-like protein with peptidoglycan-binding domain